MTIRTRLTFLYASLLAIALLVFSAATLSVLKWTLRRQIDDSLLKAIDSVHMEAMWGAIDPPEDNPLLAELLTARTNSFDTPGLYVQIWLRDTRTNAPILYDLSGSLYGVGYNGSLDPGSIGETHLVRRNVTLKGHHLRVITVPLVVNGEIRGYIQAGQSLRTVDAAIDRLLKIMIIGGALSLLASLLLGDYLTRRALQPIDSIAQTAQQITKADDLSLRIPYNGPPDELGQLTRTFNETLERLERLFNVQRRFVADVSHEMRTPLTAIRGNVDLMRRFGYDEESMADIDSEARRMTRLVEDLLLLAKADAGHLPLNKNRLALDTLVREVYNQARVISDGVAVRPGEIEPVRVIGDADRIKQLLLNLTTNALKYTPKGGSVTLSLTHDDQHARVSVAATGIGIPAKDLPFIFDRFYRVDKARSRSMGGTGLGLSIARWIADAHDGELSVTSEEGHGSTFSVTLPLAPVPTPEDEAEEIAPPRSPSNGKGGQIAAGEQISRDP